eukprot:GHRR01008800.1.p1 GENE.GHRR01008800.1~~GHRR01008800.1.p1  ORF type:complete len:113 (+),score=27.92 GHRR01008800.1:133-471(+)
MALQSQQCRCCNHLMSQAAQCISQTHLQPIPWRGLPSMQRRNRQRALVRSSKGAELLKQANSKYAAKDLMGAMKLYEDVLKSVSRLKLTAYRGKLCLPVVALLATGRTASMI